MWWRPEQLDLVRVAIEGAYAGSPTLLSIEGDPGQGKSALLAETLRQATNFGQLPAYAQPDRQGVRYGLFEDWGIRPPADGRASSSFQAAQALREQVDVLAASGPVVVAVDDLHWADPESVDSLAWVLRRAAGDQLLVVAATRPLREPAHPSWRRMLLEEGRTRIRLDGLQLPEAQMLIRQVRPDASSTLQRRLWTHTGGNPLFLRTLLAEHDIDELNTSQLLPAPNDLAASIAASLRTMPRDAVELVHAVAVLGASWCPLAQATELTEVGDSEAAAAAATEGGLLEQRDAAGASQVRVVHSLVRSAVLAGIPAPRRRNLHRRAAGLGVAPRNLRRDTTPSGGVPRGGAVPGLGEYRHHRPSPQRAALAGQPFRECLGPGR